MARLTRTVAQTISNFIPKRNNHVRSNAAVPNAYWVEAIVRGCTEGTGHARYLPFSRYHSAHVSCRHGEQHA